MTDGYEPYNAIADANGLVHLGCWVHARRYFVEAEKVLPKKAQGPHQPSTQFIGLIGRLCAAESHADQKPHRRARLRRRYSRAVLAQIRALLDEHLATTAPSGLLGKALNYLARQWPKLNRYVENETWPIDNNSCENAIRPFVVGRAMRAPVSSKSCSSLVFTPAINEVMRVMAARLGRTAQNRIDLEDEGLAAVDLRAALVMRTWAVMCSRSGWA